MMLFAVLASAGDDPSLTFRASMMLARVELALPSLADSDFRPACGGLVGTQKDLPAHEAVRLPRHCSACEEKCQTVPVEGFRLLPHDTKHCVWELF